uniref:Uncharacterized protein n=1 Tax=Knipowitschia caucasica TaxID=637954 RepID=A0AAV2KZU2_KNICA
MEEEMQQLREQLAQLKADNERLLHNGASNLAGPSGASQASGVSTGQARSLGFHTPTTDRVLCRVTPSLKIQLAVWPGSLSPLPRAPQLQISQEEHPYRVAVGLVTKACAALHGQPRGNIRIGITFPVLVVVPLKGW